MSDGKRRCARCQYEFTLHKLPLTFSREEWKVIIHLFLIEQSSNSIAEQTGFDKQRVLRGLTRILLVMINDVPDIFSGTVEVDEIILAGNERTNEKQSEIKVVNEAEVPRNNRYLGPFAATVLSGSRLLKMLKLDFFNHSSHKKAQPDRLSVQIPGKLTQESLLVDTSIVW